MLGVIVLELIELRVHMRRTHHQEQKMGEHVDRLDDHVVKMNEHVAKVKGSMLKIDQHIDATDAHFGKLDEHVGKLDDHLDGVRACFPPDWRERGAPADGPA